RADALGLATAVNRVHDDALPDGRLARRRIIDRPLRERLVASDEDGLEGVGRLAPREALDRVLDDPSAILVAAAGLQLEQLFGNLVEVVGERRNQADVAGARGERVLAVLKQRYFELRSFSVLLRVDELVDDFPKLALGLFD